MEKLSDFIEKAKHGYRYFRTLLHHSFRGLMSMIFVVFPMNQFWSELCYFTTLSFIGFLALKFSKPSVLLPSHHLPKNIDLFFTSLSAATASSMSTLEMEVFSNIQLFVLTVITFVTGEVFTSILELHFSKSAKSDSSTFKYYSNNSNRRTDQLGIVINREAEAEEGLLKFKSIQTLAVLVGCYLLVVHVAGTTLISVYLNLVPSAKNVLKKKGLNQQIFTIFTAVSTFANCGFLPTNENMMAFRTNSGLQLILIPLILMGNTLYPLCLRFTILALEKITGKEELRYMLKNSRELGYRHLIPGNKMGSVYLGITALGFLLVQLILFCTLEWNSEAVVDGMSGYEKAVGSLFQVVSSRHAGESVFDLSAVSPAVLVLFLLMMYLPAYTSFVPIIYVENGIQKKKRRGDFWEQILFTQLGYITIFVILVCITEAESMKTDPLNFSVFAIVFEVISAYGNVGFSIGYSCERRINSDGKCRDAWYGLAGKWSNGGKFVLMVVMLFGRLKKFNVRGGRAWKLF
ncbi:hypothetical protein ABFX02_12G166800 [Erythranthe guttata]